jgi:hypothetical protein
VISKRLDRFLISEALLSTGFLENSSIDEGRIYDHRPIILKIKCGMESPLVPLNSTRCGWKRRIFDA